MHASHWPVENILWQRKSTNAMPKRLSLPRRHGSDYSYRPMVLPTAQTFSGIVRLLTWCIYAMLASIVAGIVAHLGFKKLLAGQQIWPFGNSSDFAVREWHQVLSICVSAFGATWFFGQYLSHSSEGSIRVIGGTIICVFAASLLFVVKIKQPLSYGLLELCFAGVSCVFSLSRIDANFTWRH